MVGLKKRSIFGVLSVLSILSGSISIADTYCSDPVNFGGATCIIDGTPSDIPCQGTYDTPVCNISDPSLQFNPNQHDYGSIAPGASSSTAVAVINASQGDGNIDLNASNCTLSLSDSTHFSINGSCTSVQCNFNLVASAPLSGGDATYSTTISINCNSESYGDFSINSPGSGGATTSGNFQFEVSGTTSGCTVIGAPCLCLGPPAGITMIDNGNGQSNSSANYPDSCGNAGVCSYLVQCKTEGGGGSAPQVSCSESAASSSLPNESGQSFTDDPKTCSPYAKASMLTTCAGSGSDPTTYPDYFWNSYGGGTYTCGQTPSPSPGPANSCAALSCSGAQPYYCLTMTTAMVNLSGNDPCTPKITSKSWSCGATLASPDPSTQVECYTPSDGNENDYYPTETSCFTSCTAAASPSPSPACTTIPDPCAGLTPSCTAGQWYCEKSLYTTFQGATFSCESGDLSDGGQSEINAACGDNHLDPTHCMQAFWTCQQCGVTTSCSGGASPSPSASPGPGSLVPSDPSSGGGTSAIFGNIVINSTSYVPQVAAHSIVFTNKGSVALTGCVVSPLTTSQFTMGINGCLSGIIGPSASCSVSVSGNPTATGNQNDTLSMKCTDLPAVAESLTETGVIWPSFTVSPVANDFGTLAATVASSPFPMTISYVAPYGNMLYASGCTVSATDPNFAVSDSNCASLKTTPTCSFTLSATGPTSPTQTVYKSSVSITCNGVVDSNGAADPNYPSVPLGVSPYPFTASTTPGNGFQFETGCPATGQYIASDQTTCQCPTGYAVTATKDSPLFSACRPVLPSIEFYQAADGINTPSNGKFSDGYPVCGPGRLPMTSNYNTYDFASTTGYTPWSNNLVANPADTNNPYYYAYPNTSALAPNPVYLYSNLNRCVCGNTFQQTTQSSANGGTLLPASTPSFITINTSNARFAPDTYDQISLVNPSNVGSIDYATVPLAADSQSNAYIGSVYAAGTAIGNDSVAGGISCGCPNFNETALSIDPANGSQTGMVCKTILNMNDLPTKTYAILPTYKQTVYASQVYSNEPTNITSVQLPTGTTYHSYQRRIWTCEPPLQPSFSGGVIKCVFTQGNNTCDDGIASGYTSAVSSNAHPATGTAAQKFDNTVNKRLACCLNDFDPSNPTAFEKFDCVDNSGTTYAKFDDLWSTSTEGQPNAVALTNASGQLVTGFYGLNGSRCSEFSEFAGPIPSAKVNQAIKSAQQNLAGGQGSSADPVDMNGSVTIPQSSVSSDTNWTAYLGSKKIPSLAADMRRCPILVRAAMKASCPLPVSTNTATNVTPGAPIVTYTDGTTTRCAAAAQINVYLRVEQIYEIGGMAKMKTIDSVIDGGQAIDVPVSDWIRNKTAGSCMSGATPMADGSCAYQ